MLRSLFLLTLAMCVAATASAVPIGTVKLNHHSNGLSAQANLWGGGLSGGLCDTGIYSWVTSSPIGTGNFVQDWGFCFDLPQSPGNCVYTVDNDIAKYPQSGHSGTAMGDNRAALIHELWARYFDPKWVANPTSDNKNKAGAFNCAIWEIVYETDVDRAGHLVLNINKGKGFRADNLSGHKEKLANSWLTSLSGTGNYHADIVALSNPFAQDFLTMPLPVPTPEPATVTLIAIGFLSFLKRKR